uniref:Secreted protein n=1 Tax=Timema monikensis TaxID=170555 RepID=A0A7R9EES5_9NEOP|nr:unnamed protein product [Timema monikensis]
MFGLATEFVSHSSLSLLIVLDALVAEWKEPGPRRRELTWNCHKHKKYSSVVLSVQYGNERHLFPTDH